MVIAIAFETRGLQFGSIEDLFTALKRRRESPRMTHLKRRFNNVYYFVIKVGTNKKLEQTYNMNHKYYFENQK